MANQLLRLWQSVLECLPGLATADDSEGDAALKSLASLLMKIHDKSEQPKAALKRLVQDWQLPNKLGLFATSQLMPDPDAAGFRLPTAFAEAVHAMMHGAQHSTAQVRAAVLQQMEESGLDAALDKLLEATAVRLENCRTAARPTAGAATAAATTGSMTGRGRSGFDSAEMYFCLTTAAVLLDMQCQRDALLSGLACVRSQSVAATTQLTIAVMRSLSIYLDLRNLQQEPPEDLARVVHSTARSTLEVANAITAHIWAVLEQPPAATPPDLAAAVGPDFLPWADTMLVLVTYAWVLKHQGRLPAEAAPAGSSSSSSSHAAATAAPARSSSSSSAQRQRDPPLTVGQVAWQQAQGQWQHVPSTHKQLLSLFGVSPEVAVWLAAAMLQCPQKLPRLGDLQMWSPHLHAKKLESFADPSARVVLQAAGTNLGEALQPQLQQWAGTPVVHLLQPVLLYGAAHAAADGDALGFAWECHFAASSVADLTLQRSRELAQAAASSSSSSSSNPEQATATQAAVARSPALPAIVRDELLQLTLNLLQRQQQLRMAGAGAGSSGAAAGAGPSSSGTAAGAGASGSSGAAAAAATPAAAAAATAKALPLAEAYKSELALIFLLLSLSKELQVSVCVSAIDGVAAAGSQPRAESTAGAAVPAASQPAAAAEEQRRQPVSQQLLPSQRKELLECWLQHAAPILSVFEGFVRAQQQLPGFSTTLVGRLACLCSPEPPGLLLLLAEAGSKEEQVAFFNLLVSLLKFARTVELPAYSTQGTLSLVADVLTAGGSLLTHGAASEGGDGHTSAPLWLLLLGRCFLLGAEALAQLAAQGSNQLQVWQQAQQLEQTGEAHIFLLEELSRFVAGPESLVRQFADAVLGFVGQGSSLGAELSAAGYDLGPIVQGCEVVAACYPEVAQTEGVPDAVVDERFGRLIKALVSVGNALSMFAVPHCCNNPSCSNTAGLTEASLVSGKGCICAGCKVARYCGKACQAAHWKVVHKPVCRMLRARSGTAA